MAAVTQNHAPWGLARICQRQAVSDDPSTWEYVCGARRSAIVLWDRAVRPQAGPDLSKARSLRPRPA